MACFGFWIDDDEDDAEEEEEIKDKSLPKWQNWLHVERSRETRHWLPWRPDKTKKQTVEDCEDPERQVGVLLFFSGFFTLWSPKLYVQQNSRKLSHQHMYFMLCVCVKANVPESEKYYICEGPKNLFLGPITTSSGCLICSDRCQKWQYPLMCNSLPFTLKQPA